MSISFVFFNEFSVDLNVRPNAEGRYDVLGVFIHFLNRPHDPHVSWFTTPQKGQRQLTPHFTAGKRRRWLPRVARETLAAYQESLARAAHRRLQETLVPVDSATLAQAGWRVHWADWLLIARKMLKSKDPRKLHVTDRTMMAFALHVMRRGAHPSELDRLRKDRAMRFPVIRRKGDDEVEVQALCYFPAGSDRPGWFLQRLDWFPSDSLEHAMPTDDLRWRVFEPVEEELKRISRGADKDPFDELAADLPDFVMQLFGFYLIDLLHVALGAAKAKGCFNSR